MQRYNFKTSKIKLIDVGDTKVLETEIKNIIKYKCLICGYEHEYDDTWTDEKKAEVKAEVDAHHNEHIIQYE